VFGDSAQVEGTVRILDEDIADPVNHAKIECDRGLGSCVVRYLYLVLPKESSWSQTYLVDTYEETYRISHWAADSIESHPLGTLTNCRATNLSLNFKTKEFYLITKNAGGDCKIPLGGTMDRLSKPRISQFVDGSKIVRAEFSKIQEAAFKAMSRDYQGKAEKLFNEAKGK
jgi:hypothetical protein